MKKIILLLLSVVLFLPEAGYPNTHEVVADLIASEDYDKALIEAEAGLKIDPENVRILLQKGFILIQTRRLNEAVQHYINLVILLPDSPEPMNNLGVVFMLQKDYTKAVRQLNATINRFPSFTRAYENLGDTYIQLATKNYTAGRERSPDNEILVSKADLGQRFYQLAHGNIEASKERFSAIKRPEIESFSDNVPSEPAQVAKEVATSDPLSPARKIEQEIAAFLKSWVDGWSSRETKSYFSHYGKDFKPSGNRDLESWINQKTQIIGNARYINIQIQDIKVISQTGDMITLEFSQRYESNRYQNLSKKRLTLKRYDTSWLIVDET